MPDFDLDALEVDMPFEDDVLVEPTALPMTRLSVPVAPPLPTMPTPFDPSAAIALVDEPHKLFDFSTTSLTPIQQMYIIAYASRGTKIGACQVAGVTLGHVNDWMADDVFVQALQNAMEIKRDVLEQELIRRALNGSDRLLLAAVKAHDEKYQTKATTTTKVTGEIVHSWAELAKEASKIIEVEGESVDGDGAEDDGGLEESV